MATHVALLRGINVGGKNPIPMAGLRSCFEDGGFGNVSTYIQSGNVLFDAPRTSSRDLVVTIERLLARAFDHYEPSVVVRSRAQLRAVVERAPEGFGAEPARFRYDVLFLKPSVTAARALREVPTREGVDTAHAGPGVIYSSRLVSRLTQSRLNKVATLPIYREMTIRNWNTTTKLLALMDA